MEKKVKRAKQLEPVKQVTWDFWKSLSPKTRYNRWIIYLKENNGTLDDLVKKYPDFVNDKTINDERYLKTKEIENDKIQSSVVKAVKESEKKLRDEFKQREQELLDKIALLEEGDPEYIKSPKVNIEGILKTKIDKYEKMIDYLIKENDRLESELKKMTDKYEKIRLSFE